MIKSCETECKWTPYILYNINHSIFEITYMCVSNSQWTKMTCDVFNLIYTTHREDPGISGKNAHTGYCADTVVCVHWMCFQPYDSLHIYMLQILQGPQRHIISIRLDQFCQCSPPWSEVGGPPLEKCDVEYFHTK